MKEKTSKAQIAGISAICVILTLILTTLLLACIIVQQQVRQTEPPKAVSAVQLDKITVKNSSKEKVSLARLILDEYIQDSSIEEEKMKNVLREGNFRYILGDKVNEYNVWLASGGKNGDFPELTADECIMAFKNNAALLFRETGYSLSAENEKQIKEKLEVSVSELNTKLHKKMEKGPSALVLKASIAGWFWIVPAVLLLAVLVWLIVMHVKGKDSVGKAIRMFSITMLIPCIVLILWGLLCTNLLENSAFPEAVKQLRGTWLTYGGIGTLAGIALLGLGILWKLTEKNKKAPILANTEAAPEQATSDSQEPPHQSTSSEPSAPEIPESQDNPKVIRRYCRFCGEQLVNNDAKFCYKCGKQQEQISQNNSE